MIIGVPKEIATGERRVALVPEGVKALKKLGVDVLIETGAGVEAGFTDQSYIDEDAKIASSAAEVFNSADIVIKIAPPQVGGPTGNEIEALREGSAVISLMKPLDLPELAAQLAARKVTAFSTELMPRITRAQSMDVLSSQSTIAGYRAVLMAAMALPRVFPMMVTAAGTLRPAKAFVIGAGVAGLQALGSAKRIGAVTSAYDTRVAVREQVQSVGAKFIELDLDTGDSEDKGGYAKAETEEFYIKQREELGKHVALADVVITTALVPGRDAPLLITADAVRKMRPGSVIVDLAAEKGGNCELTEPDKTIMVNGVTIIGDTNLPAHVPAHASQMFSKNLTTFLDHLIDDGKLVIDREDEITAGTLTAYEGEVTNEMIRQRLEGNS
ncbi:MAG: Re/Si-specific NAD(P)(+) transhydrogenase subunit alpha [Myxococcota bacterium]|nr:Re/Si-specific NAD(P)(+) transhydrogenase subunit alpha [Myxococcota bacterium]